MRFFATFNNHSKEKRFFIKKIFDDISGRYDLLNGVLSLWVYRLWHRRVMKESGLSSNGSLVDFCTGTGELLIKFYRRFNLSRAVGIDISPGMLEIARKKIKALNLSSSAVDLCQVPAECTDLSEKFDCATIAFALRNVSDVSAVFLEMKRVIKDGGRVIALELTIPEAGFFKFIYKLHLKYLIPFVGNILSGNREAYAYLGESIINFPKPDAIVNIMEKSGLVNNRVISLSFGIATIFTGERKG